MALTITYSGDWFQNVGSLFYAKISATLGTYATGGISFTPAQIGLGAFIGTPTFEIGAGYLAGWDSTNQKILIYRNGASTPVGTIGAPAITVTEGAVTIAGGAAGTAIGITPDDNTGSLTKAAASARTIPRATFLGSATTATSAAPVFTGTASTAAAFTEVSNAVDLSAVTIHITAHGR